MSALEQLKGFTKVVADTGDFEAMAKFQPEVCSTVPKMKCCKVTGEGCVVAAELKEEKSKM